MEETYKVGKFEFKIPDLNEYKVKPLCDLHPSADKVNLQYKSFAILAEANPRIARQIYENLEEFDTQLEVSIVDLYLNQLVCFTDNYSRCKTKM